MNRFFRLTLSALALPALALSACHKSGDDVQGAASSEEAMAAAGASSVTPADGMPTMSASPSDSATNGPDAVPGNDPGPYLAKASAGDLFEIESSRAILKTTQDPRIVSFARMMIKDHEASTALLKKIARAADINVAAPHLNPDQQQSLEAIKAAQGKDADKAYLGAQRNGHAAALMLHKAYAADGNNEALKAAAAHIVPVVQHHIEMLDAMSR